MAKKEVLNSVLEQIKKRYGEGSIMWLGGSEHLAVDTIPTGSLALDIALGIGGIPRGRIIEVFGPESSGKTSLALHLIAEAQKLGGSAAFIDAEHALDPKYAQAIGVNLAELLLSQPNSGEQALEITEHLVRSGAVEVIVIDSVAALVPEAEIAGAMGDAQVGLQARLMSQAMRKLSGAIHQSNTTVLFINQIRSMISAGPWGPSTTTSGGLALKFYTSVRLEIKRIGSIEENHEKIGNETLVRVVKNKLAPPFKEAKFDILYGKGIAHERELLKVGEQYGIIKKSGARYSHAERQLGQGIANCAEALRNDSALGQKIAEEIRIKAGLVNSQPSENSSTSADEKSTPAPARKPAGK
ncbi:recombinase RecA [Candidatus Acetothermia bacterium]|nr:recombinase RecA [Candidatus Acetothermia bacterium]MBI3642529.1 recombinase RecA [Candidatus Acetothermia bacterium]